MFGLICISRPKEESLHNRIAQSKMEDIEERGKYPFFAKFSFH